MARPKGSSGIARGRTRDSHVAADSLPREAIRANWTPTILALMMFVTPALGVPNELMLQDTLKSMVVVFAVFGSALLFFWQERNRRDDLRWHALMWLPLTLVFFALGSMVWSHGYLAGVEAIRWLIFSLILWLGINTLSLERLPRLMECIHWGAVIASVWAALQFYADFAFFPQAQHPASTFTNRNFFSEYLVCTIPFSALLLAHATTRTRITLIAFTIGFNIVALMMTGTRSALVAMFVLVLVLPWLAYFCRKQLGFSGWRKRDRMLAGGVFFVTIISLGLAASGNPNVIADRSYGADVVTPFGIAIGRLGSVSTIGLALGLGCIICILLLLARSSFAGFSREQSGRSTRSRGKWVLTGGLLLSIAVAMLLVNLARPTGIAEMSFADRAATQFAKAFQRMASVSTADQALSVRFTLWNDTFAMIKSNPVTGVGAGAWEVMQPLYQADGAELETDYCVHNEYLQLLAEYGLTGLVFLLAMFGYLLTAAWRTFRNRTPEGFAEAPVRAMALASMLALLIISSVGFPWRMAATVSVFAICLALLAASDARLLINGPTAAKRLSWRPAYSRVFAGAMMVCLVLTAYISRLAAETERKLVTAANLASKIGQSGDFNNPKWDGAKLEVFSLTKDAIAINPHYRKITPHIADQLANWGDWKSAVWVWESVAVSRPHVAVILSNIARGYAQFGDTERAFAYLARSEKIKPKATSVRSLRVVLMSLSGKEVEAAVLAQQYMNEGTVDYDLLSAAYVLGMQLNNVGMAIQGLELRIKGWPAGRRDSFLLLADVYLNLQKDDVKAAAAFRGALEATAENEREALRRLIPPKLLKKF
jgi:O-antigen ligase